MSSRIIVNGRVVAASRDGLRTRAVRPTPPLTIMEFPQGERELPKYAPASSDALWTDPQDGIVYRVLTHLSPEHAWVSARTVQRWYNVLYADLATLWRDRVIDAALERGSLARRFRILDPARCEARALRIRQARDKREGAARELNGRRSPTRTRRSPT